MITFTVKKRQPSYFSFQFCRPLNMNVHIYLTFREFVLTLGEAIGKSLTYQKEEYDVWTKNMKSMGIPGWQVINCSSFCLHVN